MANFKRLLSYLKNNKYTILFFVLVSIFIGYITLHTCGEIGDEGLILPDVQKMAHGHIIYRDFFSWITPGLYYLLFWVWNIFGQHYILVRILTALIAWLTCIFIYLTCRTILNKFWSALNVFIFITLFYPRHLTYSYHWLALLLALAAAWLINLYLKKPKIKYLALSGFMLGLDLWFLHTQAIVAVASTAIFLLWYDSKNFGQKTAIKNCLIFLACAAFLFLILLLPFIIKAGLPTVWFDLVISNLYYYPSVNYLPLGHNAAFILVIFAYILLFFILFLKKLFKPQIIFYYLYSLLIFISVCYRFDSYHLAYIYPRFALPLSFYALAQIKINVKKIPEFLLTILLFLPLVLYRTPFIDIYLNRQLWLPVPTKIGPVYFTPVIASMRQSVLQTLEKVPDQQIFIYPYSAYYYTFSGKTNPTRYNMIYGEYLGASAKTEIINDLKAKNIHYILYVPAEGGTEKPEEKFLSKFLTDNFTESKIKYPEYDAYYYLYTKK